MSNKSKLKPIYLYDSYKEFIEAKSMSSDKKWGMQSRLAQAIGCQQAYLSQVLKKKAELNTGQGLALCRYWELSEDETEFFLFLIHRERASDQASKRYFTDRINKARKQREDIESRLQTHKLEAGQREQLYYSSWIWPALHVLVAIPEFQTSIRLSEKLGLSKKKIDQYLGKLQEIGIVKFESGKWQHLVSDLHLRKDSPLTSNYHNQWRMRAVDDSNDKESDGLHYTSLHALSVADFEILKAMLLEFIDKSRTIVGPSDEQEAIAINIDLFRIAP